MMYQEPLVKTMNNELITIYLTETDAQKFLKFQQNYDTFMLLVERGVFNIHSGSAILDFDNAGKISTIRRADTLYNIRTDKIA